MALALGSTTYTSVTWTTGDVITEAKLDNMVANDQAYDSHAAQGILLNNTFPIMGKDSGGTNQVIAGIDSDNILYIGDDDLSGTRIRELINPYRFDAYKSSTTQTVNTGSSTVVVFDAENYDTNSNFASNTYTAPVAGLYLFTSTCTYNAVGSGTRLFLDIFVNGAAVKRGEDRFTNAQAGSAHVTAQVLLAASNTVDVRATPVGANTVISNTAGSALTFFQGIFLCTN